ETGALRAEPKRTVTPLDADLPTMITAPISNPVGGPVLPMQQPPMPKLPEISEPYIKEVEPKVEPTPATLAPAATVNVPPTTTTAPPQRTIEFEVEPLAPRVVPVEKEPEPTNEKVTFDLYDEAKGNAPIDSNDQRTEAREARLTPNEHQQRVEERMSRMREMNMRMRSPNAVAEYEREPAYVRKKVQIVDTPHSTDSNVSRYSLSEGTDENGERRVELKRNNPYLHDKVD
ncbi:MAG TPA: hypothetical protein PK760_10455, partial [Flavobacteriales bacterium]|nr:hypothetical protein [Flavobacteriales bacterium]